MTSLPKDWVAVLARSSSRGIRASLAGLGLSVALGASGCHKDKPAEQTKTTEAKPAPVAKAESRKSSRSQPDEGVEVPTEEDFEDQIEKQITANSNLQKELDQIEKQISGG
ncbi:MAG TPA: hypothetical protein VFS67_33640 [Polyangiaceae bacterium]|jgi:hypothetical protein|nr:hypothetical protein [Polyangiaceae bacterium]